MKRVCKGFAERFHRLGERFAEFEIICPRVCMLIKAILVTIMKTLYVKLFGTFLFGFGGFDNRQSVVCFLIVILSEKNRTIKSLTHAT